MSFVVKYGMMSEYEYGPSSLSPFGKVGSVGQDLFSLPLYHTELSGKPPSPLDTLLGTQ